MHHNIYRTFPLEKHSQKLVVAVFLKWHDVKILSSWKCNNTTKGEILSLIKFKLNIRRWLPVKSHVNETSKATPLRSAVISESIPRYETPENLNRDNFHLYGCHKPCSVALSTRYNTLVSYVQNTSQIFYRISPVIFCLRFKILL